MNRHYLETILNRFETVLYLIYQIFLSTQRKLYNGQLYQRQRPGLEEQVTLGILINSHQNNILLSELSVSQHFNHFYMQTIMIH